MGIFGLNIVLSVLMILFVICVSLLVGIVLVFVEGNLVDVFVMMFFFGVVLDRLIIFLVVFLVIMVI